MLGEENWISEIFLKSGLIGYLDGVLNLRKPNRDCHIDLIYLEQFLLLICLEFLLCIGERNRNVFNLGVYLVSLLFEVTLSLRVFLYLFIILAYLSHSFKIFMIVFDDCDIWLLVFILELVLTLLRLLLLFFVIFTFVIVAFFLFFLHFCLLLKFADSLSLPDLVVSDDSFSHLIIIRIDKFSEYFLLLFILFLELLVQDLYFSDFCGKMQKC